MLSFLSISPVSLPSAGLARQLPSVPAGVERRGSFHRVSAACTSAKKTGSPAPIASNSLYEVLGISIGASNDDIKAAYRSLVRICHPDAVASRERKGLSYSGGDEEFIRIHAAYSTLSDPERRADYDRKLFRVRIRPLGSFSDVSESEASSFCKYPRRNWETDQCW